MIKKQTRSKWFTTLVAVLNIAIIGIVFWKYEDISSEWFVALMLLWLVLIFAFDNDRRKKFDAKLAQQIEGVVAELRGGKDKRKKWLRISVFVGLLLVLIGIMKPNDPVNLRVFIGSIGVFTLLSETFQFFSSKNRPQIRLVLLEDKLLLFEAPNQEKTILMKDLRNCIYNEKKSYVFSFYNQKITIDSRDFEEEKFAEFKARLQSVTDYWMDKQLSNSWPS